jgi:hypothetical protein
VSLIRVTDWVCPIHWAGQTHEVDEDTTVFACMACPNPADCASNGECERAAQVEEATKDERR